MGDNKTNASPQETPRSASPDSRAAQPSKTTEQQRRKAAALNQQGQEAAAVPTDADEQPTPPRLPRMSQKSDAPPPQAPAAPRRSTTRKLSEPPEGTLADLVWMPPAEDRVAQFLSDVTDIPPPPTRAHEGSPASSIVLSTATSPEEAERKKARAEPFWSQMAATPLEPPAPTSLRTRSRRSWRKRRRLRLWLALSAASLVLVIAALAVVVYTHPGLLHLK